jgi:hypothetical protein
VSQHSKQEVNWKFLLDSSKSILQDYERSRLNFAANVRKEIAQLLDTWVDESSNALLARWLIEQKLAAEASAICTNPANGSSGSGGPMNQPAQGPCVPSVAAKPSTRTIPHAATETHGESDKILGQKALSAERLGLSS